jgi:putative peptidoglycan lipid II flippase
MDAAVDGSSLPEGVLDGPPEAAAATPGAATRMGAAAALSRAFGGVRVAVIAAVLGTTALGDTFQASNSVSNVLFELLAAGALSAVLVPTFVQLLERGSQRDAEKVAGGLLSLAVVALTVVSVIGVLAAPAIAGVLTSAVDDPVLAEQQRELATFLLRFFIPQLVLYAVGAVATAALNARGSFSLPALAPIGNTVVLVGALVIFRAMAGPQPSLPLSTGEMLVLGIGATLGVVMFVGVPAVALHAGGFRMHYGLRGAWRDGQVRGLLHHSAWASMQHAASGVLLAAAIVVGGGVEGGVIAYQYAFVIFLAPYGILAQPILTTLLPALSRRSGEGDREGVGHSVRAAVATMAVVTLPVTAACVALSVPIMEVLAFGQASSGDGVTLLAAALASLAIGLLPYGGFLLLARASYALGDSRTPAIAALGSSALAAVVMIVAGSAAEGADKLLVLGGAHSAAFLLGAILLVARLRPTAGWVIGPEVVRPAALAVVTGALAWVAMEAWAPDRRLASLVAVAVICLAGAAVYFGGLRLVGGLPAGWRLPSRRLKGAG